MRRLLFLLLLLPAGLCAQLLPTKVARTAPVLTQGQSAQIWADSSGHLHIKCDSGCSAMSLTGLSADTLGYLWHVIDSLNLRYGNKHLGAVAIDTTKGCLATANGCDLHVYADTAKIPATDSLNLRAQKSGNELYMKCDSGCGSGGGGGNPTGGYLNGIGKDTLAAPLLNGKVAVADSITSVPLTTGGYIGLDSIIAGHCLASPNGCDLHAYVDTLGHVRDSLNASVNVKNLPSVTVGSPLLNAKVSGADSVWNSLTVGAMPAVDSTQLRTGTHHAARVAIDSGVGLVYATKTQPAITNNTYTQLPIDTAGRLRVKVDTSVALNVTVTGTTGNGLGPADSVQLRTGTKHAARVAVDSLPGGTNDTLGLINTVTTVATVSTVTKVTRSGDSIYFSVHLPDSAITSTAHMGRTAIDSLVGGTLISRANPSYTSSSGYEPISADTNGRQRVRLDSMSGCPTENYPSNCPLHVVADSSHVGYPPGDSLQRSDSLIIADTVYRRAADTCVTAFGGKSVADSASFPAVSGKYIYLTGLSLAVCDTLAVTGTTYLTITTSNLRGLTFETGNAQAVGTCTPIQTPQISNGSPVRSTASNTLTQVKIPAAGTGAYGYISMCGYYHAMRMLLDPNEYAMRVEPAREPRPKPPTFDVWRDAA